MDRIIDIIVLGTLCYGFVALFSAHISMLVQIYLDNQEEH